MAKVKIHGWLNLNPPLLIVSTSNQGWFGWIPCIRPVRAVAHLFMHNGKSIKELGSDAEAFIGAIPVEQLNVKLCGHVLNGFEFEISGLALTSFGWYDPINWETSYIAPLVSSRVAARSDMPIFFDDEPPSTRPRHVQPVQKSFYELRLEESRAKWREEEASAPRNRAFEFL